MTFAKRMNEQANPHPNLGATNHCALASLILSIAFVILGPLGSIPAIICGRIALREYRSAGIEEGQGMAKTGILIGWIGLVVFAIVAVLSWTAMKQVEEVYETIRLLRQR